MIAASLVECLGWTLLHSIWQLALLTFLHEMAQRLLRTQSPQIRYLFAGITMFAMVAGPLGTYLWLASMQPDSTTSISAEVHSTDPVANVVVDAEPQSFESTIPQPVIAPLGDDSAPRDSQSPAHTLVGTQPSRALTPTIEPFLPWIVGAWLTGVLLLSCRQLGGWCLVERLRRRDTVPVDRQTSVLMEELCRRIGVHRSVEILETALLDVPSVVGWLRPAILLPLGLASRLPIDQIEAILLHELAHIRRRDYLANGLQAVAEILLFYHPGVWWVSRRMRLEREFCADDLAATACGNRLVYAKALTTLEDQRVLKSGWAVAAAGSDLRRRIDRILGVRQHHSNRAACWMTGMASSLFFFVAMAWGQIDENTASSVGANQTSTLQDSVSSSSQDHQHLLAQNDTASAGAGNITTELNPPAEVASKPANPSDEATASLWTAIEGLFLFSLEVAEDPGAPIDSEYVIRVESHEGRPIAGAKVTVTGLSLPGGGSAGFPYKPVSVAKSDVDGNVRIDLSPMKSVFRRARSIFLQVDHPDYPLLSTRVWIGDAPAPGVRKIVLAPSQTIEIRAHRQDDGAAVRGLYPQLRGAIGNWSETDGVLTIRRLDLSSGKASRWLRIVHAPAEGTVQFSDIIDLEKYKDALTSIDVALKPGVAITGQLSDDVPRPIRNGRVIAAVYSGPDYSDTVFWGASAEISADGTFVIEDLPPDEDVQLTALCDGWVSQSPTLDELDSYIETYGLDLPPTFRQDYVRNGLLYPRLHRLSGPVAEAEIPMERTLTCEITVIDADKKPVPDAQVVVYAQQSFFRGGGGFELGTGWNTPANVRTHLATGKPPEDRGLISMRSFEVTTDENGSAVVSHLAGGVHRSVKGSQFHINVTHPDYLTQFSLLPTVTIQPGETGRLTVRLSRR